MSISISTEMFYSPTKHFQSKNYYFSNFDSNITVNELINTEKSPALHSSVADLMWLLSGTDQNFDTMVEKITSEVVEE